MATSSSLENLGKAFANVSTRLFQMNLYVLPETPTTRRTPTQNHHNKIQFLPKHEGHYAKQHENPTE